MTPSLSTGETQQVSLPATDQTVASRVAFSFPRTPVAPGATPAARDLVQVSEVRRICDVKLRAWGLHRYVDPALLLLSELVTNAIWHGSGQRIGVCLSRASGMVEIQAWGGPVSALTPRSPGLLDENGRGLLLVDMVADAWGVNDAGWVWCTITTHAESG
ncbi:ATP-binding protein [Streptomyces sp. L2]|uniref:ATP-binding protein n=1 Tax=Streptomyces sp. L2 TaxID=2162665 RepID=UPI0010127E30|nr:ATP-binding protein [Streptomyces sp. L2]